MLHEISRSTICLPKYEEIEIVWHNNVLTVRCDSGIHFYDFSYNLKCLDKNIDFIESKILTSRESPATDLFPKNYYSHGIRNMELAEMVLDPSLWPHNKHLMEVAIIITFEWSPVDFIHNHESVLAAVNSAGNIDLYAQGRHKWSKLENLSSKLKHDISIISNFTSSISNSSKFNFEAIKEAAYALETSSICWSPELNEDKSCYFVTGQKNGLLLFWLLKHEDKGVNAKLIHHMSENFEEIVTMKWIATSSDDFILITANVLGQIIAYQCQIAIDVLKIVGEQPLWADKDKMIAQYIQYEFSNENIVIVCNKHRHLLTLMIDKDSRILYQNITNINDQRITSIVKTKIGFYASTANRELYRVNYILKNQSFDVRLVPVETKSIPSAYELHSVAFSNNDTIVAFALLDRTVLYRKVPMKLEIILYVEESLDLLSTILNNPTKTLTYIWDVVESLRCKILKSKILPKLDYNQLYKKAQTDIFDAKVYLIILTFYNSLENIVQNGSRGLLPETSTDEIKSHILAYHSVYLIRKLCEANISENEPDKFKLHCLHMAGAYLKDFCKKNKMKMNELLSSDIVTKLQKIQGPQYTCQWCDNILNGSACQDGHINSFCSITFTPIESNEYLVCRSCGATARSEIYLDKPKCIFCDLFLCHCHLPL